MADVVVPKYSTIAQAITDMNNQVGLSNTATINANIRTDNTISKGNWITNGVGFPYKVNNTVKYLDGYYICVLDNVSVEDETPDISPAKWKEVVNVTTAISDAVTATTNAQTEADNAELVANQLSSVFFISNVDDDFATLTYVDGIGITETVEVIGGENINVVTITY